MKNDLVFVGNYHRRKRKTTLWSVQIVGTDERVEKRLGMYRTKRRAVGVAWTLAAHLKDGRYVWVGAAVYSRFFYTNIRIKNHGGYGRMYDEYHFHNAPLTALEMYRKGKKRCRK